MITQIKGAIERKLGWLGCVVFFLAYGKYCKICNPLSFSLQSPSSTTPPIEINSSRLTKLVRRTTDKKSEFLKALKDDRNGEMPERHESNKLEEVRTVPFLCDGELKW